MTMQDKVAVADLVSVNLPRAIGVYLHKQNFCEAMYVIRSEGKHYINGTLQNMTVGNLFVGPA